MRKITYMEGSWWQTDFILVKQRFKNSIKMAKTFCGADTETDHNLLVADVRTRLKHIGEPKLMKKWDVSRLKTDDSEAYTQNLEENLRKTRTNEEVSGEQNTIKDLILKALQEVRVMQGRTGGLRRTRRIRWMQTIEEYLLLKKGKNNTGNLTMN